MRILIATGGSPHSEIALRYGAELARRSQTPPTILTVIRRDKGRSRAETILARAARLVPEKMPATLKVRVGHPAEEILREAEEGDYDLILVGDRQRHPLMTRFLLGSVAERVVIHAPCPVIIAKGKAGQLRRVLICDSGIETPSLLDRIKTQLPALVDEAGDVTVLHVMSQISSGPGVPGRHLRADADRLIAERAPEGQLLTQDLQRLARLRIPAQPKVRHGLVVDEILAEARSGDYDLVVIGTHREQGWQRLLLDDLAQQIIRQVDRPILVAR
jgi:nucleotide-binding universal stress UspA family protein